jgi:hypothetical protein
MMTFELSGRNVTSPTTAQLLDDTLYCLEGYPGTASSSSVIRNQLQNNIRLGTSASATLTQLDNAGAPKKAFLNSPNIPDDHHRCVMNYLMPDTIYANLGN